jgi:hypothetical protein
MARSCQRAVVLVAALLAVAAAVTSASPLAADFEARAQAVAARRQLQGFRPIPIDASVVLLFLTDVQGGDNSPCAQMVKRALEFKVRVRLGWPDASGGGCRGHAAAGWGGQCSHSCPRHGSPQKDPPPPPRPAPPPPPPPTRAPPP